MTGSPRTIVDDHSVENPPTDAQMLERKLAAAISMTTEEKTTKRLLEIFSARLVLEVFGGAGAIWGFSEALGLRVPSTVWFWRPCALTFGAVFFMRWTMQIQDYVVAQMANDAEKKTTKRLLEIFSARLVLEVFGGAGAIWGFSEALGLRVPSTVWFWRPCALTFGAIFFLRWTMQIQDYVAEGKLFEGRAGKSGKSGVDDEQVALTYQEKQVYS